MSKDTYEKLGIALAALMGIALLMVCTGSAIAAICKPCPEITANLLTPLCGAGMALAVVTAMFGIPFSVFAILDQMKEDDDV